MQYLGAISKMTQWSLFISKADQFISQWSNAPTSNAEEAEVEQFYEDLPDLLELTPKKDVLFIIWNAKVGTFQKLEFPDVQAGFRKGRGTRDQIARSQIDWNAKVGSQEIVGVTGKFGFGVQNEAGQRVIEFWQEDTLVIANTLFQQHKRRL